jgi:hypothetical protein
MIPIHRGVAENSTRLLTGSRAVMLMRRSEVAGRTIGAGLAPHPEHPIPRHLPRILLNARHFIKLLFRREQPPVRILDEAQRIAASK